MKNKIIVIVIIAIVLISVVISYKKFRYYSDNLDKDYSERLIESQRFINKLNNYDCKVIENNDENFKNKDVFYSYKTEGESCPFEIIYVAASNKEIIDNIGKKIIDSIAYTNATENSRDYYGVRSKVFEDDKYQIVLSNKVCILYLITDIKNKNQAFSLLDEFGYKKRMYN